MNTINKKDIEISPENPFGNCKLGREKIARSLTRIIKNVNVDNGFVISIDSPWGTGKTMWKALLEKDEEENIICVKFNAWDNDFYNDPLISILENLDEAIAKDIEKITKNFAQDSWENVKSNLKTKGKTLICDAIKAKTHGLIDISGEERDDDLLKNYGNLKEKNEKIKKGLMELKKEFGENNKLRIVFFIDELDRCRPDYAIKVLEIIKHFFRAEGYIFILSLDKSQLSKSISTIYGQGMDSEGYLRRFIDVDYTLPMSSKEKYVDSLIEKHGFSKSDYLLGILKENLLDTEISLRDIQKIFFKFKIFLLSKYSFQSDSINNLQKYLYESIYGYFFMINFFEKEVYDDLLSKHSIILDDSSTGDNNLKLNYRKTLDWLKLSIIYKSNAEIKTNILRNINYIINKGKLLEEYSVITLEYKTIEKENNVVNLENLFETKGNRKIEFIVKNDIEMINGIND